MQLQLVAPRVNDSWITFLLREGYTVETTGADLGVRPAELDRKAGGYISRLWMAFTASARRGFDRLHRARQRQAARYIRNMRAQCGYAALPSSDISAIAQGQ